MRAPVYEIDLERFWRDPYPDLKTMRADCPIAYAPQLDAVLMTRRDDIFVNEKKIDIFSSVQPEGLMVRLMGQNMMRKDGDAHARERKAIFPSVSPVTVKKEWNAKFSATLDSILEDIAPAGRADFVRDIATRICGEAMKIITGLTQISFREMDRVSQGMIDGCANYQGDPDVEERCNACTTAIDRYIDEMTPVYADRPDNSLLSVLLHAGLPEVAVRANVKLAISGGQNELRDVLAGLVWALLTHRDQRAMVEAREVSWAKAFQEYARWISPVGMSPRRVAKVHEVDGIALKPGDRVFFMFSSANRDESCFARPDVFDISQDSSASIPFGAGPHFCAGAAISKSLVAEIAAPALFQRLPQLRLAGEVPFGGWAFRGALAMPVAWTP